MGDTVTLVNPAYETAQELKYVLEEKIPGICRLRPSQLFRLRLFFYFLLSGLRLLLPALLRQ